MQYGDLPLSKNNLFLYVGTNPANDNFTFVAENFVRSSSHAVNQRDADLLHFWTKVCAKPLLCHNAMLYHKLLLLQLILKDTFE